MSCFAIWTENIGEPWHVEPRQLRVFAYRFGDAEDRQRALTLARAWADDLHRTGGQHLLVEDFHACDVGVTVYRTAKTCPHCARDLEDPAELTSGLCTSDDCPRHDR